MCHRNHASEPLCIEDCGTGLPKLNLKLWSVPLSYLCPVLCIFAFKVRLVLTVLAAKL